VESKVMPTFNKFINPKDKKIIPISNAFTLNIKNEREEALKNLENLRKSVKLQKRSNPMEKIVSKLIISTESKDETKTEPTHTQTNQGTNLNKDSVKVPLLQLSNKKSNHLQSIDEENVE
jgi:hypothetical protein